jgi:glycosyltransferase involved in cell wall biosynthesis
MKRTDDVSPRVLAFPRDGHAYVESFYRALEHEGVRVVAGEWSGTWLRRNVDRHTWVHLHWPSQLYQPRAADPVHMRAMLRFCALALLVRRLGGRIAWTAHNLYPHDEGHATWPHALARQWLVRLVSLVLAHGPTATEIVRRRFHIPPRKLLTIQHGHWIGEYPDGQSREEARTRLGIPQDQYVHLFFGLCRPYKNLEDLIAAFAARPESARLMIVGRYRNPSYQARIESLSSLVPGVQLVPEHVPDDSLQTYMKAADSVVLPYRDSLTSGAAILALGFGRPVVAPAIGSLVDVIDARSGLLYDAAARDALERALVEVRQRTYDEDAVRSRARQFTFEDSAGKFAARLREADPGT